MNTENIPFRVGDKAKLKIGSWVPRKSGEIGVITSVDFSLVSGFLSPSTSLNSSSCVILFEDGQGYNVNHSKLEHIYTEYKIGQRVTIKNPDESLFKNDPIKFYFDRQGVVISKSPYEKGEWIIDFGDMMKPFHDSFIQLDSEEVPSREDPTGKEFWKSIDKIKTELAEWTKQGKIESDKLKFKYNDYKEVNNFFVDHPGTNWTPHLSSQEFNTFRELYTNYLELLFKLKNNDEMCLKDNVLSNNQQIRDLTDEVIDLASKVTELQADVQVKAF